MKRFRVKLTGKNFLLNLDGEHEKFSFYAIRVIRANDAEAAKRTGLIQIHHELNQHGNIVKGTWDIPKVEIDSIEELKFFQFVSKKAAVDLNLSAKNKLKSRSFHADL